MSETDTADSTARTSAAVMEQMEARAAEAFGQRRYDLAAGLYRRLADAQPHVPEYRLKLAHSLHRLGCRLMAAEAYGGAAEALQASGDPAKAIEACRTGLGLQPANARLLKLLHTLILQPTDGQHATPVLPA